MSPLVQRHIAFRRPQSVGMPRHALRRRMANGAMPAVFTAVAARWAGISPQKKLERRVGSCRELPKQLSLIRKSTPSTADFKI